MGNWAARVRPTANIRQLNSKPPLDLPGTNSKPPPKSTLSLPQPIFEVSGPKIHYKGMASEARSHKGWYLDPLGTLYQPEAFRISTRSHLVVSVEAVAVSIISAEPVGL